MTITLPPELEAWLHAHVAKGDFASIEEAARQIIADRMAEEEHRRPSRSREVLKAGELSDADLEAIAASEMDSRHQHLDCEL